MNEELASRSLSGRIVLLCVVDLDQTGTTPVHTGEVVQESRNLLENIERDLMDSLSEAAVNRALNRLEADGLVEMSTPDGTNPTGKGRPTYTLSVGASEILDPLTEDEEVAPLAEHVQQG